MTKRLRAVKDSNLTMNLVGMYNQSYSHRVRTPKTRAEWNNKADWIAAFVDDMSKVTVELD